MYQLNFLSADVPLTKKFVATADGYDIQPYPFVRDFTSHHEEIETIDELFDVLKSHADQGHCLLKGLLRQPLVNSSRAGMTVPEEPTNWLLLDLDFSEGWDSIDSFLNNLDPCLFDVSYIFQHSSSAGIKGAPGLRGHIWILLDQPMLPSLLKSWLRIKNITTPGLSEQIELAANGLSLRWPLDITTCQNDKLIYIAPPICEGFDDPLYGSRFTLVRRSKSVAHSPKIPADAAMTLGHVQTAKTEELRKAIGLPKRKPKYKLQGDTEVLQNPSQAAVTGVKVERGFTYLNLNGGDSWGYYFPTEDPKLVYNFKGEPAVFLKDIAPEFYDSYMTHLSEVNEHSRLNEKQLRRAEMEKQLGTSNFRPFVFRDRLRDAYYNALYFPDADRIDLAKTASLQRLQHFMLQYGEDSPEVIEDWAVEFDPTSTRVIDFTNRWVNTFNPTKYLRYPPAPVHEVPPMINRILDSVCVGDAEAKNHFLNWLAHIIQTRRKTGTSWVFHGVSGTGKGLLVSKVLKPLLGPEHVVEMTTQNFEDNFNAQMEKALILWIDEFHIESARQTSQTMNRLKNLITEDRVVIRGMRQEGVQVQSFLNVIIATNHPDPVQLTTHDRRFNVAPAQERPLKMTQYEIEQVEQELEDFAGFLHAYKVNETDTRRILLNEARDNMIVASQTTVERFFSAARAGDLDYFMGFLSSATPISETLFYSAFETMMVKWCRTALTEDWIAVSRTELQDAYTYILGVPTSPAKFRRMLALHRIPQEMCTINAERTPGHYVRWVGTRDEISAWLESRTSKKPQLVASM